jgi:hypothetical protein
MNQQLSLFSKSSLAGFLDDLAKFSFSGAPTLVDTSASVPVFVNEFWTARQRQANRLHEISYRACFKPQLPAFFIDRLTCVGDIVYDPFMGRGTTPIEAALRQRVAYGNDINPLSKALTAPRLSPPTLAQVEARLAEIPFAEFKTINREDLLAFYHPQTLVHLQGLRDWLISRENDGQFDIVDAWIRMVAINRLTGHSPGFFSVYTLPPNQAVSVERQRKINAKRSQTPPMRDLTAIILKKSKSLLSQNTLVKQSGHFVSGPSTDTPSIPGQSVALTVTSPPFLDIVDYVGDNWLRCWFLGIDAETVAISRHRTVEAWTEFTAATLAELARVTRPGGHVVYEVGEVRNGTVKLEDHVLRAAADLSFDPLCIMINQQEFTKTANCWGVTNNKGGTNSNRMVVLRKSG